MTRSLSTGEEIGHDRGILLDAVRSLWNLTFGNMLPMRLLISNRKIETTGNVKTMLDKQHQHFLCCLPLASPFWGLLPLFVATDSVVPSYILGMLFP